MILMIDNYDSFTYNLVQYLKCLKEDVLIYRNDSITLDEIEKLNPDMIVLSPGPCTPKESGICKDIIKSFKTIPILGICLGHQTIGYCFGANVVKANEPVHGKVSPIIHKNTGVFRNLPNPLKVTRYHSLIIERESLPDFLEVTAETDKGEIMGIRHKEYLIEGVQFHPESILSECGMDILKNFLMEAKIKGKRLEKC
ncbi:MULTISPECIES: anthranilate synthase component II [Clostridium]|uniref:Anthranilate synthase component II n=1 Tax=Clostridium novyi (strain NT) TaxID=386415 RepID=A0Q2M0_CLONN|nr:MULTISPECIES: aminodeoxychorismate/anthranilate synthase component II [Clostridium]ABK61089.1 anthranilate synthase component II [Clostridium novyi NT]KEH86420.1 anthranilate synthase [Clostridium novyi A str. NCTC 538]KEH89678.1 anthranilate synthase [Clostridium novyi A str. 4540]KEH90342.1 anthranilate synthase [Clostridium novyi A str. BKT29909]KEH93551.1 anthranilate synthase [Clostridium botulinum C/D str. It1]